MVKLTADLRCRRKPELLRKSTRNGYRNSVKLNTSETALVKGTCCEH